MADTNLRIQIGLRGSAEVAAGLQSIQAAASRLKGGLLTIGAALAGAAGLGALGQAAINTAKLGGELSDLSARTGISARALITLRQAFKDVGLSGDDVGRKINYLQRSIIEAASSGGAAADALAGIGLSAQSLASLAPEDQFSQVASAISGIQNPAERSAAAMQIFGKSGAELLPLFAEGGAIQNAERVLGRMPEILARNVPTLDAISDSFDRLPNKATQLFAGIFDQIGPTVQAILDAFEKIDLTKAGQNIGAFVMVGIEEFKAGRFDQFIADTIEAGTQIGVRNSKAALNGLFEVFSGQETANAIGKFSMTLVTSIGKALVDVDVLVSGAFYSLVYYIGGVIKDAFVSVFNFISSQFENLLNYLVKKLQSFTIEVVPTGQKFKPFESFMAGGVSLPKIAEDQSTASDALARGYAAAQKQGNALKDDIDNLAKKYNELIGVKQTATTVTNEQSDAEKRLADKIDEQRRRVEENNKAKVSGINRFQQEIPIFNARLELQRLENQYNRDLLAITQKRSLVESSWLMTANEKFKQRKDSLQQELQLIDQQRIKLLQLREQAQPGDQQAIDQQMLGLRGRAGGIQAEMTGMGPSPESFSENFQATVNQLRDQFGSVAQQMAQTFATVFNAAIQSISNGITGLIMGTMSWGQALMSIATTILTTIVQSIVQMGVRWIATQILMATVGKSIAAASVAATVPIALAQSAVWATPATLATIASYGSAAAAAPGFIAASQGIVLAQSMAAFREGGYTGDGDPNDVAGLVHRGEFVVPADAVDRIGLATLEAISSGNAEAIPTSSQGPSPITLNMGVFDDPRRLSDWARSNEGRTVLVDILRQHAHEFSS